VKVLKTVLRVLLWLILALVLYAGTYFACLFADIPQNIALACAFLPLACIVCIVLCARAVTRRRRRLQIQHVVTLAGDSRQDRRSPENLIDNRWSRAIAILKTSYLGSRGNPIYALPWYMLMGRTGAGKSSAVSHCGLNAMLTDVGPDQEHTSTLNCDWYFFREGVVLDTAGRYAVPVDEATDNAEWLNFLRQLGKYRRSEPLNGVVAAIAADTLYGGGEHLLTEARCLRRRLDEIMRVLGAKFPVYLMVTKIDLKAGMSRVLENLPPDMRQQAMGQLLQSPDKKNLLPVDVQIQKTLNKFLERFRSLCLFSPEDAPQPQRLLAWEEVKAMMPALAAYAGELFAENPYQEAPLLRGIFFSSALRTDAERPSRAFPGLSGVVRGIFRTRENAAGFFLYDFFSRVLPPDRNLNRPVAEYLRWRSSVRISAYAALLIATFGLAGLLSFSYQHNYTILQHISAHDPLPAPGDSRTSRLLAFEQRFRETERLERAIETGLFPSMGLNQCREGLDWMNRALNDEFAKNLLTQANRSLERQRSLLTGASPDKDFILFASDLVWRFDLVSAARQGKRFADLLAIPAMPQGLLHALDAADIQMLSHPAAYSLARYYYNGATDASGQEQTLRYLKTALARLPEIKGYSMQWLIYRASELGNVPPLKAGVFWPGAMSAALDAVQIEPAYTVAGFNATVDYLERLSLIIDDSELKPHAQEFLRWYADSYAEAWKDFASVFVEKVLSLSASSMDAQYITAMSSSSNPFFAFALRMQNELRHVRDYLSPAPAWVAELDVFAQALRIEATADTERVQPGLRQRITETLKQFYETADDTVNEDAQQRHVRAELLAKEINAYLASLRALVPSSLADDLAFNAVQAAMPDERNSNAATAKLTEARAAALSLRQKFNPIQEEDSLLFILDSGPLSFFTDRLMNSASCHIQALWEGNVLSKAGSLPPTQMQQRLFAEQGGLARDFADTTLKFFFNRTLYGYEPQELDGLALPFTNDFLLFLNAGLLDYRPMPQSYAVTVNALPIDVNDEALEKPHAVVLSLSCAQKLQELTNYNSPSSMRFTWQSDGCGDTNLAVSFKELTLNKLYAGENGFVSFLHDFEYGSKTFHLSDFPGQEALLQKLGVTDITLRYTFAGAGSILAGARHAPETLPFVAAECRR
jgi:type VI secretion system protein ImpL